MESILKKGGNVDYFFYESGNAEMRKCGNVIFSVENFITQQDASLYKGGFVFSIVLSNFRNRQETEPLLSLYTKNEPK